MAYDFRISLTLSLSLSLSSLNAVLSRGLLADTCRFINSSRNTKTLSVSSLRVAILTDYSYCCTSSSSYLNLSFCNFSSIFFIRESSCFSTSRFIEICSSTILVSLLIFSNFTYRAWCSFCITNIAYSIAITCSATLRASASISSRDLLCLIVSSSLSHSIFLRSLYSIP